MGSPLNGSRDNRAKVLRVLHERGPLAKKDLEFLCGLSRPTIDKILQDLLAWGLVEQNGYRASSGGRRSTLYKFNERCRHVLGIDFEIPQLGFVICDLAGRIAHRRQRQLPLSQGDEPEALLSFVTEQARQFVKQAGLSIDDLLGIGFGAPAFLSQRDGASTLSFWGETLPPWRHVPVKALLEEALGVPVHLGNDAAFMALAESRHLGPRERVRVMVYLALRQGAYGDIRMGGAVLIDGKIYRGEHGNAVSLREAYVQLKHKSGKRAQALGALLTRGLTTVDQGDVRKLRRVLEEHLLVPMLNLITLFDPGRLVIQARLLGGEEEAFIQSCAHWLQARLGERFAFRVSRAREGEWACAHGAALSVLQSVFCLDDNGLIARLTGTGREVGTS